jgi:hypothetical protein
VYAYRDRLLKDFERRLDEEAAIFLGPSRVTQSFLALRDRDTEVLMQGDQPISHRRFLEVSTENGVQTSGPNAA